MSDNNISPPATARRSKLTKRRRNDDCTTTLATTITRTCSLQSLNNSSLVSTNSSDSILQHSQQNQQQQPALAVGVSSSSKNDDNVNNHNHERHWKENVQNDSRQPISSLSLKNYLLSSIIVAGRRQTNDSIGGGGDDDDKLHDASTNSEELTTSTTLEQECSCSCDMLSNSINNQSSSSSWLGNMDNMQHHSPYIMSGINWNNCYSSSSSSSSSKRLELDMEKAFTTFRDNVNLVNQKNESTDRLRQYGIVHPLVGRIDPHDVVVMNDSNHNPSLSSSFAFPTAARCNIDSSSSCCCCPETTTTNSITLLQWHGKKTGLGISIPYSWYRFPPSKRSLSLSSSGHNDDGVCNVLSDKVIDTQEVNYCNDKIN